MHERDSLGDAGSNVMQWDIYLVSSGSSGRWYEAAVKAVDRCCRINPRARKSFALHVARLGSAMATVAAIVETIQEPSQERSPTRRPDVENICSDSDSYVAEHVLESAENSVTRHDENVTPNSHFARDRALAPPSV
jgi:hypothetical protein